MQRTFGWCRLFLLSMFVIDASAKTVALWPMEENNSRCALHPDHDLTRMKSWDFQSNVYSLPWNLPPNPDPRGDFLFDPVSVGCYVTGMGNSYLQCYSPKGVGRYLSLTNDFTVEGWCKLFELPSQPESGKNFFYLFGANESVKGAVRWIFSIRHSSAGTYTWEQFAANHTDQVFGKIPTNQVASLTNQWHHYALTFRHQNETDRSEWNFYLDGVKQGQTITGPVVNPSSLTNTTSQFLLAGRGWSNPAMGRYDYWRVSDEVLTPDQFLNAGGEGTILNPKNAPETIAYWPLNRKADGTLDLEDKAGFASFQNLSRFVSVETELLYAHDQPFRENPPNPTVSLPSGNAGCLHIPSRNTLQLGVPGLGTHLEVTNSFTIESWFKMEDLSTEIYDYAYLFNTRYETADQPGWVLQLGKIPYQNESCFQLFSQQVDARVLVDQARFPLTQKIDWSQWHHLALVHDAEAADGLGIWTLYVDGASTGVATNLFKPTMGTDSQVFRIGGRGKDALPGYLDCIRVSRTALQPNQFLIGSESVADSDLLAFWPMNATQNGFDATDLTGQYPLNRTDVDLSEEKYQATLSEQSTEIFNPGGTKPLRFNVTNNFGSATFSSMDGMHPRAFLKTRSRPIVELFQHHDPFTLEFYCRRHQETVPNWELLAGLHYNKLLRMNLSYRENGIVLWDNISIPNIYDVAFPNTKGILGVDVWNHVAITHESLATTNAQSVWKCYVNGHFCGELLRATATSISGPGFVLFGGRYWSENSFRGEMDSIRLTKGILTPDQFLCATNAVVPTVSIPDTEAFWPLDAKEDGTSDLSTTDGDDRFALDRSGRGTAIAAQAKQRVKRLDGSSVLNNGSISLDGSAVLSTENLGLRLDLDDAFTVEGWIQWNGANAEEMIVGTYRYPYGKGWNLAIKQDTGTPRLTLTAGPKVAYSPCIATTLLDDISSWRGTWVHLALSYQPDEADVGVWRLWVNGENVAIRKNRWNPSQSLMAYHVFYLGSPDAGYSFTGNVDLWRVTSGVLGKEELLYQKPKGTILLLR